MFNKIRHSKFFMFVLCLMVLLVPTATMAYSYNYGPDIYVDGYYVYSDTAPIVVDGRTLVPVRALTEALGCQVDWYPSIQGLDIYAPNGQWLMTMYAYDYYATVNYGYGGEYVYMDAAAEVYNGRVMVPLRFIAETLGLQVTYDYYTGDIYIYSY